MTKKVTKKKPMAKKAPKPTLATVAAVAAVGTACMETRDREIAILAGLGKQVLNLKSEVEQLRENGKGRIREIARTEELLAKLEARQTSTNDLVRRTDARLHDHLSNHEGGAYAHKKSIQILSGRCDSFTKLLNEQHDKLMQEIKAAEKRVSERLAGPLASFNGTAYGDGQDSAPNSEPPVLRSEFIQLCGRVESLEAAGAPEWAEIRETKAQLERTASNIRVELHDSIASLSENVSSLQELVLRQEKQIAELVGKNAPPDRETFIRFGSRFNHMTGGMDVDASIEDIAALYSLHSNQSLEASLRAALEACSVRLMK